jgi:hypothetical protein
LKNFKQRGKERNPVFRQLNTWTTKQESEEKKPEGSFRKSARPVLQKKGSAVAEPFLFSCTCGELKFAGQILQN